MTIGAWILYGVVALFVSGAAAIIAWCWFDESGGFIPWVVSIGIAAILCASLYIGMNAYYKNTESGKRALKSQESNFNSGIERIVTIYDVNGNVIKQYEGKFDVEYDDDRILFDDENGKRHVVYYTTGTVAIDEK